jgi:hypothetical protein
VRGARAALAGALLAAACGGGAPSPPDGPPGRVRLVMVEGEDPPPTRLVVAVVGEEGQGARSEVLEVLDGAAELSLPPGRWTLHAGCGVSPTVRPDEWLAPETRTVTVVSGATVVAAPPIASPAPGGLVSVPVSLGLPSASAGALDVACTRGALRLDRRLRVPFDRASADVLWPPLPAGAWSLEVRLPSGAPVTLRATVVAGTVLEAAR